jgi:hypothetical protein
MVENNICEIDRTMENSSSLTRIENTFVIGSLDIISSNHSVCGTEEC